MCFVRWHLETLQSLHAVTIGAWVSDGLVVVLGGQGYGMESLKVD